MNKVLEGLQRRQLLQRASGQRFVSATGGICWHTGRRAARRIRHHARALLGKHAPCRTERHRCQPTTPWFDADCAKAKCRTRAFERRYRRTKLDSDRLVWIRAREKQPLFAAKKISSAWEKKLSDSKRNPKKLWRHHWGVLRKVKSKPPNSGELTAERFSNAFQEKLAGVRSASNGPPCTSNMAGFEPIDAAAVQRLILPG